MKYSYEREKELERYERGREDVSWTYGSSEGNNGGEDGRGGTKEFWRLRIT